MPPLQVMFDGVSYWLWDGFHRRWAADRAGLDKLPCIVTDGTREDAQWASYGANCSHGLRRTNADKAKAVKAALRHPNGAKTSDRQIAEHVGVSPSTVAKFRGELESSVQIGQIDSRTVNRNGTTYKMNTAKIGATRNDETSFEEAYESMPAAIATAFDDCDLNAEDVRDIQQSPRTTQEAIAKRIKAGEEPREALEAEIEYDDDSYAGVTGLQVIAAFNANVRDLYNQCDDVGQALFKAFVMDEL